MSISYEIVSLKDFNSQKIFTEYYYAIYASAIIKEPGSEIEGDDLSAKKDHISYDVRSTLKKYERKTITTRADFLYDSLPSIRKFFEKSLSDRNFDMFYYPNDEDDVIGEVEFQVISRTLNLENPGSSDAILQDQTGAEISVTPVLTESKNGGCLNFNIISAKIPRLKNNERFGIKWSWSK
jgi:hypothetical protein